MAWPPSNAAVGFKAEGYSTFVWGTQGYGSQSPLVSSYIIKSVRATERVDAPIIENGSGLTATQILLLDGINFEITVVDDTNINPPISGTVGNVVIPALGNNGSVTNTNVAIEIVESAVNLGRKTDGERVLTGKSFVLFTPT